MAAGILPAIGSKYGPCKEPCDHTDCAFTRKCAEGACRLCHGTIGYEKHFFTRNKDYTNLVHESCVIKEEKIKNSS